MSNEVTEHYLAAQLVEAAFTKELSHGRKVKTIKYFGDYFYIYTDENVWERRSKAEMRDYFVEPLVNQTGGLSTKRLNTVLDCLTAKARRATDRNLQFNSWDNPETKPAATIPVLNGLVVRTDPPDWKDPDSVSKFSWIPHTPEYFSLNQLPFRFNEDATCPQWEEFIEQISCGKKDRAEVLQQWAGYLFMKTDGEQKFLLYFGEGQNGKGVYTNILQRLVGDGNYSNVGLDQFSNKYAVASMMGKMVNMSNESSKNIKGTAENILKTLTGGDTHSFEAKYKDPTSCRPTAKIMLATNDLPRFNDRSRGTWRRVLLLPFELNVEDGKVDKNLFSKLGQELPGILNWALKGMLSLEENRGFTKLSDHDEMIHNYRNEADPSRDFLLEFYEYSEEARGKSSASVYEHYKNHCKENGFQAMASTGLGKQIKRVFPKVDKIRARIPKTKNLENIYKGLRKKSTLA
ncbi:hypothetical protein LCGC14_0873420 [marine sediment metagenome]|uniref:SF3 helicase domain-containing protein n=1 Tax=marine sediment metagenome TaxID=412755 RepID=A0A0F9P8Z2_9ZZZZ